MKLSAFLMCFLLCSSLVAQVNHVVRTRSGALGQCSEAVKQEFMKMTWKGKLKGDKIAHCFVAGETSVTADIELPVRTIENYCISYNMAIGDLVGSGISNFFVTGVDEIDPGGEESAAPPDMNGSKATLSVTTTDILSWNKIAFSAPVDFTEVSFEAGLVGEQLLGTIEQLKQKGKVIYLLIDDVSMIRSDLAADAGRDTTIAAGDSVFIGRKQETGLECVWHASGNKVGNGAGIWVKPGVTTTYVVTQKLCRKTTTDAVVVTVKTPVAEMEDNTIVTLYADPTSMELTVTTDKVVFDRVSIIGSSGQVLLTKAVTSGETQLDISNLSPGAYRLKLEGDGKSAERSFIKR